MYRAYHAFRGRGLSNQEGQTTHAVYRLRDDAAQADRRSSSRVHGGVVRSGRPHVSRSAGHRLQGQPRGHARRSRGTDQLGAPGVRGDGRADPDRRRLRSGRRDRDGRDAGACRGLRGGDRLDRQGLLPDGRPRQSASTTRARTAPGSTATASSRSSACGRSRSPTCSRWSATPATTSPAFRGSARRARSISSRSSAASMRMLERLGELKPKQREALSTHRADALRSRELVTIRTDVPLDVDLESLRYTRPDRGNGATSCFHVPRLPGHRQRLRAAAGHGSTPSRRTTRWSPRCRNSTR